MTDVEQRLREIEERASRATPGPWYAHNPDDDMSMNVYLVATTPEEPDPWWDGEQEAQKIVAITLLQSPRVASLPDGLWEENAEFIAHAREDIPALISALRAEMEKNKRLTEALEEQITYWYQLPSGVDEEADWQNPSPEDAIAHTAGLAVQAARAALRGETP